MGAAKPRSNACAVTSSKQARSTRAPPFKCTRGSRHVAAGSGRVGSPLAVHARNLFCGWACVVIRCAATSRPRRRSRGAVCSTCSTAALPYDRNNRDFGVQLDSLADPSPLAWRRRLASVGLVPLGRIGGRGLSVSPPAALRLAAFNIQTKTDSAILGCDLPLRHGRGNSSIPRRVQAKTVAWFGMVR